MKKGSDYDYFGLDKDVGEFCWKMINKPTGSRSTFFLEDFMENASNDDQISVLKLLTVYIRNQTVDQSLVSGNLKYANSVLTNILLRHVTSLEEIYVDGRHFITYIYDHYYPYVNMAIAFFIIPVMIKRIELNFLSPAFTDDYCNDNDILQKTIIDHLKESTDDDPNIKAALECLVDHSGHGAAFLIAKMNSFQQSSNFYQELAFMMDFPPFLQVMSNQPDFNVELAIAMHANQCLFNHHGLDDAINLENGHFSHSVGRINLEGIGTLLNLSDNIKSKDLTSFLSSLKYLSHTRNPKQYALMKEQLIILLEKNVTICQHQLKKMPPTWRKDILDIYQQPRWTRLNPLIKRYYSYYLKIPEGVDFDTTMISIKKTLIDSDAVDEFVNRYKESNKNYYLTNSRTPIDILESNSCSNELVIITTEHSNGDDILLYPTDSIFHIREGNKIYLFDKDTFPTLLESGSNFYTRSPLPYPDKCRLRNKIDNWFSLEKEMKIIPITEFLNELLNGRKLLKSCECMRSNPIEKIHHKLDIFDITYEQLENCILEDIEFKLAIVGFDMHKIESTIEGTDRIIFFNRLVRLIKTSNLEDRIKIILFTANIIKLQFRQIHIM
tara:strand:+ start:101147 stop:102976 length:1830 start_codon:yes stop_codon:yes gene_type:complete